jgi:HK97 family phage major capsid protein
VYDLRRQLLAAKNELAEVRGHSPAVETRTEERPPAGRATAQYAVTEGPVYERGNGNSYFQDLMRATLNMGDEASAKRLRGHGKDVAEASEKRDLDRTDGNGGQFVPPLWLMSQYIELARPGRPYANLVNGQPLPPNTDSLNIPKVATGTAVGVQNGDNTAVAETDMTDTSVAAPVRTIAGQQDISVQLLDQSPVSFDEVIFRDLVADYATKVDLQVIAGSGSNGQVVGIRNTSGIQTIAFDDTTPTVAKLYSKLADAIQRIHTQRFMPPTAIVMAPKRWAWFLSVSDSTGRPLVVPQAGNPQNAAATLGVVGSQGVVGQMHGLPVVIDPSLPTNLGTGTNQDVIHILRASDQLLYESGLRSRVLPDVGSGTLTVRLQVYGYLAFTAGRYPKSIVEIGGTGLVGDALFG